MKAFYNALNSSDLMQRALVDFVIDGPKWLADWALKVLKDSERGSGLLEDVMIIRDRSNYIRVRRAVELLRDLGHDAKADRVDGYCIWIGDESIDFIWDTMNGEPQYHPVFLPTHERNVDALVDRREVLSFISKHSLGEEK